MARFDWIRFDPDGSGGGGSEGIVDDFDGTDPRRRLGADPRRPGRGRRQRHPADPGSAGRHLPDPQRRQEPDRPRRADRCLAGHHEDQLRGHRPVPPGRDHGLRQRRQLHEVRPHRAQRGRRREVRVHQRDQRGRAQRSGRLDREHPGDLPERLLAPADVRRDQRGRATTRPTGPRGPRSGVRRRCRRTPRSACSRSPTTAWATRSRPSTRFTLTGDAVGGGGGGGGTPSGPSYDDQFDGATLDKTRWNAIVRDTPAEYQLAGGELNYTLSQGDIYTGDTTPPPNNFLLQDASHAGADWVIETKINSYTHDGGYAQGGLLAYKDGDNYVKLDAITDVDQPKVNRIELRSEIAGVIQEPAVQRDRHRRSGERPVLAAADQDRQHLQGRVLVRRRRLDGDAEQPGDEPDGRAGLRPVRVQPAGHRGRRQGVVRLLHRSTGRTRAACEQCDGPGRRRSPAPRSTRIAWNAIAHDDPTKYAVANGALKVTTTAGEIYQGVDRRRPADPAGGRPRRGRLGPRDQADQHAGRRLLAGRHPGLRRRQQLRQDQRDLRRRATRGSTASSCAPRSAAP